MYVCIICICWWVASISLKDSIVRQYSHQPTIIYHECKTLHLLDSKTLHHQVLNQSHEKWHACFAHIEHFYPHLARFFQIFLQHFIVKFIHISGRISASCHHHHQHSPGGVPMFTTCASQATSSSWHRKLGALVTFFSLTFGDYFSSPYLVTKW